MTQTGSPLAIADALLTLLNAVEHGDVGALDVRQHVDELPGGMPLRVVGDVAYDPPYAYLHLKCDDESEFDVQIIQTHNAIARPR